eukprot:1119702-Pleurochrysis_carterae.AAC.1
MSTWKESKPDGVSLATADAVRSIALVHAAQSPYGESVWLPPANRQNCSGEDKARSLQKVDNVVSQIIRQQSDDWTRQKGK